MGQGAYAAASGQDDGPAPSIAPVEPAPVIDETADGIAPAARPIERAATILLAVAVIGWAGLLVGVLAEHGWRLALTPASLASALSAASGPLALVGIGWLLVRRTSRREALRFGATAEAMHATADQLDEKIAALGSRIEAQRRQLADDADRLLLIGDETTSRLGGVSAAMRAEAGDLARQSAELNDAAAAARVDMGVLLADLPRVEQEVERLGARLREFGVGAREQAGALDAEVARLAARAHEADEVTGAAAQRLAAHLVRIDGSSEAAGRSLEQTGAAMVRLADDILQRTARSMDESRRAIDLQGNAVDALATRAKVILASAGEDALERLSAHLATVEQRLGGMSTKVRHESDSARALADTLDTAVAQVEARFEAMGDHGAERTADLAEAIVALSGHARQVGAEFGASAQAVEGLIARARQLRGSLDGSRTELVETLPEAMAAAAGQAETVRATLAALLPDAAGLRGLIEEIATRIRANEARLADQGRLIADGEAALTAQLDGFSTRVARVRNDLSAADEQTRALTETSGPLLVEAMARARDTAAQAQARAREALAAIVPEVADALSRASGEALERVVAEQVEARLREMVAVSERAVRTAHQASERLMRQMLTISETSSAVERRIEEARAEAEARDADQLSRRVALLIEALNSSAIDITKALSNDVADSSWAAYLRGDRGVFTRRAVRLLDAGEARDIFAVYEADQEFREQVNRYIHDFESMLRRVLAERDGHSLSVTLLSSDMGKLYVALAQAIERLR